MDTVQEFLEYIFSPFTILGRIYNLVGDFVLIAGLFWVTGIFVCLVTSAPAPFVAFMGIFCYLWSLFFYWKFGKNRIDFEEMTTIIASLMAGYTVGAVIFFIILIFF